MEFSEQEIRMMVRREVVKMFLNRVIHSPDGSIKINGNQNSISITISREEARQIASDAAPVTLQRDVFDNRFS